MENVLKLEKENIAEFQKKTYEGDKVDVRFSHDIVKIGASNHVKIKLDSLKTESGAIYTASKSFDVLFKITGHAFLHPVKVKKPYETKIRICYHHNIGHVIFSEGECKTDNDHYGYVGTKIFDIYSQAYPSTGDERKSNKEDIGSVPCLEEWNTVLPGWKLRVKHPYFFTRSEMVALPILKSKNNSITFIYTLKTKLKDLLKMETFDKKEGKWVQIETNLKYLEYGGKEEIKLPELWGRYGETSDEERNWRKTGDEGMEGEPRRHVMIIEDWEIGGSKNPVSLGSKEEISLAATAPTKHVFWMASHVSSGPCNYTTDKNNVYKGWNPCASAMIKYGTAKRTEELTHDHFDRDEFKDFGWLIPDEKGYNVWTLGFKPKNVLLAEPSTKMKEIGATLTITLGNTDPYLFDDDKEELDEDGEPVLKEILMKNSGDKEKYNIHVVSVVVRKMEVYWEKDSLKYKYSSV